MDACFFQHRTACLGASPLRRRTERDVREDSCGKGNIVFAEGDAIHVLCAAVSFKTARLRAVRTRSRVVCDSCGRSVPAAQGFLLSDSGQSRFKQEQFIRTGCLMTAGTELWEAHECNKPGQLRKDCSVYKKRIAEKGNKPKGERVETTGVVHEAMVEMWECDDGDHVFVFGDGVSADVQRSETQSCTDCGASRSACHFGYASELTTRGTTPPLFAIDGSSVEQRGHKKVHWKKRDSVGEMKEIGSTLVDSSVWIPVASVLSFEMNETSVTFTCSGDYYLSRQPRPPPQSSGVSLLTDQKRSGTYWVQAAWRVMVEDKSFVNKLAGFSPFTDRTNARVWNHVMNRRDRTISRRYRGRQDVGGVGVR